MKFENLVRVNEIGERVEDLDNLIDKLSEEVIFVDIKVRGALTVSLCPFLNLEIKSLQLTAKYIDDLIVVYQEERRQLLIELEKL